MEVRLTVFALLFGFVISTLLGPIFIPMLTRLKFGQVIREDGPGHHHVKSGTPTMGGFIFITGTVLALFLLYFFGDLELTGKLWMVITVFLSYGLLGFLDDILIVLKKENEGLTPRQKLLGQLIIAVIFYYMYISNGGEPVLIINTLNIEIQMGWLYGVFILFLLVGTSNATNITDGLDGLCGGLSAIAYFAWGVICLRATWISGNVELALFCFSLVGGLLGFLVYNVNPAKVFMGDMGSMAIGGAMATIAILISHEITLIIIGGVFVIETLSVIIQVISYKTTKRRVFLMSPIHHHFELLGWKETEIVKTFWIVGFLLALLGIAFGGIL